MIWAVCAGVFVLGGVLGVGLGHWLTNRRLNRANPVVEVPAQAQAPDPAQVPEETGFETLNTAQDPKLLEELANLRVALDRANGEVAEKTAELAALQADMSAVVSEALVAPRRFYASYDPNAQNQSTNTGAPPAQPHQTLPAPPRLEQAKAGGPDHLSLLAGCTPATEAALHDLGIFHFDQVALWTEQDQTWVHHTLREQVPLNLLALWVTQAQAHLQRPHELID
ncbi:MAG: hypothetical protein AAF679_02405 [Pseudomonadota bacterium]